jgi:predicted dinucleotide-binding enzyme
MRIGILGTGVVGRTLGTAFTTLGHDVRLGSRHADNKVALTWAGQTGQRASASSFADTAAFGELLVLATLGTANRSALEMAGSENFGGKIVIDATNPLEFPEGRLPRLAISGEDSGGERVQAQLPEAFVVKAFNTVGSAHMFRPDFPGGPPDMFVCGDDGAAKERVGEILRDFGWGVVDVGGIESSRYLEAMCLVWVLHAFTSNPPTWDHAFKLLRK